MNQDLIYQFQEISGLDFEQSKFYLEMSGNNLEIAMTMFFEQAEQQNQNINQGLSNNNSTVTNSKPDWFNVVWPSDMDIIPDAWLHQKLEFDSQYPIGLVQYKNGPCGILSVIQAVIIKNFITKNNDFDPYDKELLIDDKDIAEAIYSIIMTVIEENINEIKMAKWHDESNIGYNIDIISINNLDLLDYITSNINNFKKEGGILLIIYTVIINKGTDLIKKEILQGQGNPPMIEKPNYICNTDLMVLLMSGNACGNVGAYTAFGGDFIIDTSKLGIGMLSYSVYDAKIPMNQGLMTPKYPVWIMHGGDHFTVGFISLKDTQILTHDMPSGCYFYMYHYNGLKPNGPKLSKIKIKAVKGTLMKVPLYSDFKNKNAEYKVETGEIYDIVQADKQDKDSMPKQFQNWRYEVILGLEDPNLTGEPRPPNSNEPHKYQYDDFSFEQEWRCSRCYFTRYKTMCFGINKAGSEVCEHCGRGWKECGRSIWLRYDEILDEEWREVVARRYQPKIVAVLKTKWPQCVVTFEDCGGDDYPCV
eukprot:Mrub_02550.p1 GENE.Mrub_02550~~Mrub_02550.p1  ORF type:complete len:532 (+),score=96.92 Mrub_02550:3-1598(+)